MRLKHSMVSTFTLVSWGMIPLLGFSSPLAAETVAAHAFEPPAEGALRADETAKPIRFNFKGATFEQVIDFFSRETGLPVIWETPAPEGTLDYLSPESYDLPEALRVLNIILHSKGVNLRVSDDMLYLRRLNAMQRTDIPTFIGTLPPDSEVRSNQIVTVVRPMVNALAKPMAERLAQMVAEYGAVTAMEQQNSIVITETAAQVRRLLSIVDELDRESVDGQIEIFKLTHAKASEMMTPLRSLLSQRVEKFVINQQGQQVKIEEDQMPGLTISADDRTNSIIAKGTQPRLEGLRSAIALLDVPASAGGRAIRTITLTLLAPGDAARRLGEIYNRMPVPERPIIIPLDEFGQVTIVGSDTAIAEGVALLREIDPPGVAANETGDRAASRAIVVQPLEHANPDAVIRAMQSLLTPRQQALLKIVSGPDGRSVILSGMTADVAAVQSVIPTLDRTTRIDRQLRLLRVPAGAEAAATLKRCLDLYHMQNVERDPLYALETSLDAESGTITAIGSAPALDRFANILRIIESAIVQRETRQVRCAHTKPSELAETLRDLSSRLVIPGAHGASANAQPPSIDPYDDLDLLLITATNEQHQALSPLILSLDVPKDRSIPPLRILQLRIADASNLANTLTVRYNQRSAEERSARPVSISADHQTNALIVAAHPDVLPEIVAIVDELNVPDFRGREYDGREIRIFPLRVARAEELARTIDEMFPQPPAPLDARGRPLMHLQPPREVVVRSDRQTNSLIVDAPLQRMTGFEQLVEQLDRQQFLEETEVRTYPVTHADVNSIANTLRQLASSGSLNPAGAASGGGAARLTTTITADPMTKTLIVSGPVDIFERVERVLAELDVKRAAPATAQRFFRLKNVNADSVANMVRPVLLTRIAEDVPGAPHETAALLNISADRDTNTLILSAPAAVMQMAEELIRQLDESMSFSADGGASHHAGGAMDVRIFQLTQSQAANVANAVRTAIDARAAQGPPVPPAFAAARRVTIVAEPTSNSIIVTAPGDRMAEVESLIKPLDQGVSIDQPQVRTVFLKHARAENVAETVKQLLAGEEIPIWMRYEAVARNRQLPGTGPDVRVAADRRLNAVVISAPPAVLNIAEEMVAQLDISPGQGSGSGDAASRSVRVLTVQNADAREIAANLQSLFADDDATDLAGAPVIRVDHASNTLLIRATPSQFEVIEGVVSGIDRATIATSRQMQLIPVDPSKASAADIARALQRMLSPGGEGADVNRSGSGAVEVITLEELLKRRSETPARGRSSSMRSPGAIPLPWPHVIAVTAIGVMQDDAKNEADITIAVDEASNSLIVIGAPRAVTRLLELARQVQSQIPAAPTRVRSIVLPDTINADALSRLLTQTMAQMTPLNGRRGEYSQRIGVITDAAANALIVTCTDADFAVVGDLLAALAPLDAGSAAAPLRSIELRAAVPSRAAEILRQVALRSAAGGARPAQAMIIPDDNSGILLVRASAEVNAEIDRVLAEIDRDAAQEFEIRTLLVERANANAVATAIQRLYDDRARIASAGRGRREQGRRISIIGDQASRTVLVAASETDFEQIQQLVKQFDSPAATSSLTFRVFELRHARAMDIHQTVQSLLNDLLWNNEAVFFWPPRPTAQRDRGTIAVRADARLNALIVTGEGDRFELVEQLIDLLDAPATGQAQRVVKLYRLRHARTNTVAEIINEVFGDGGRSERRWWMEPDPGVMRVRIDESTRTLIVSASAREHEGIAELIESIDAQLADAAGGEHETAVLAVEFAQAGEVAQTLRQFLVDRARATNTPEPRITLMASQSSNSLVVSASPEDLLTIRDLLSRLDQADVSGDRVIEIIALQDAQAMEIARIVREQFTRRTGGAAQGVAITADVRTNSIIVNAPQMQFGQVKALIERLDTAAASDETIIRTYSLEGARAEEAQRLLGQTLQLDDRGRTPGRGITIRLEDDEAGEAHRAVEVKARIVADRRSNTLIVTATAESFPVIESLIRKIDTVPTVNPVEYRIIQLEHALADDVRFTLQQVSRALPAGEPMPRIDYNRFENQLIIGATVDQFEQINKIISEMDKPSQRQRITDFVPMQFAEAQKIQEALSVFYGPMALEADTPGKRNVRIVADPATNSLVISADANEWEGIRSLLKELDSEEYDSSLQLRVLPLMYADSVSVARAINEAFQGTIERGSAARAADMRRPQGRDDDRRDSVGPTVLVESDEWVRASAEPLTNSVIISASRQNVRKIEQIVEQLDVADFAKLPPPQLIPITSGDPTSLAQSLSRLYEQTARTGSARGGSAGKSLVIVGDTASNTIIVRAEEDEFRQIKALAEALQQQASEQGMTVRILQLTNAPAARVASAIREAFTRKAQQTNQPLSIQTDPRGNSLVIASTGSMYREIEETARQLDAMYPGPGVGVNQAIFIIELENISPDAAKSVIESIGLHQSQPEDSISRIVSEPIKVSVLQGRSALIIVASPADRELIVGLLKAVDAEPNAAVAEAQMRIVRLKNADAASVARILSEVLAPGNQQSQTALARAIQEQVRRLAVRRDGLNEGDLKLDLTRPVRIIPDTKLNAVVIYSTESNVRAIEQVVAMFDQLPITDAVTVQIFPLQNIAAEQFSRIVRDLFTQGKQLGSIPGTNLTALPGGMVGKALIEQIAITTDERTNTVIVAGKEDSVALVEVLSKRLDSDIAAGWVEPRVIPLRFADAGDLAQTLQAILIDGITNLPQATPIQRQIGRLRMARQQQDGGRVLESDVFQPMTRLVIRPEPQMNALVLVGTPVNLEIVGELVKMLDIEAASPSAAVRIYPIEHASAARLATTITRLFDQQVQSKAIRPEDRVIVQAEERTNTLIVTTSPRSFAVLESLLKTLDAEIAPDLREIRRIELRNASATRLATLVQQLMDARLERLRRVQPETADLERATIVADARTNSLIVAAGNESFEVIRRLASDLDTSTLTDVSLVNVLPVMKGNVDRIAAAINQIMERRYADQPAEIRASQRPLVLTDPRSNSLLVAANPEDLAAIADLVVKLSEAPINPAIGLHVVSVEGGMRAEHLAPRLQRLMAERQQSLGEARTPSDRVSIEPDMGSNSLIIAATDENLEVIRGLIGMLAQAGQGGTGETELIMLTSASRAADMVTLLNDLHVREANRTRGENTVRITADERLNALLVNAPPQDVQTIKDLVSRLDGAKPTTIVETKFIPLQSANAREVVSLIESVLSGRSIAPGRLSGRQATVLKYIREAGLAPVEGDEFATEMVVGGAIRESISLTPDVRTNTVIVAAPRESMRMIEQMIRDLDASNTGSQDIRIFKLVNADALAMAEILTDLFTLRRQGNIFVLKPREGAFDAPVGDMGGMSGLGGTELTAVPDERQQLSITVDSRTNSLLVSGTPTYLDLVERVVKELDAQEADEREVLVYQLRNAVAGEVSRVLTQFIDREQQKLVSTMGTDQIGSAARLLEREITIVGDEKSNTVLVSASPRYMERVKEMIQRLDVDPPQVLIQVMLAEVTLDSTDDWGIDFRASGRADGLSITGGFGLASAFVTGMGVPNLAVASSDFDLLIRAMQSQGRLQVLSNPSVMAANNEVARIQVGETIRVPETLTISDTGRLASQTAEKELGVILQVTPSINPDGFVRMVISPEISSLSSRTTQISEDFEAPVIIKRKAETTVTVFDGQTIVLGGLISDRFERRDRKVPFFGDLPVIGALFRSETQETAKTELLIVLTPHVIESPASLRVGEITDRQINRLTLPEKLKNSMREHDSFAPGGGGLYDAQGNRLDKPAPADETKPE
ncbi:MAG TPA: secretin N-terminal domain-containing protein [Phycisphaerales bacterium]|nr:secretin N-terminal domain-containing protein [Phycisphaerales bacterium]